MATVKESDLWVTNVDFKSTFDPLDMRIINIILSIFNLFIYYFVIYKVIISGICNFPATWLSWVTMIGSTLAAYASYKAAFNWKIEEHLINKEVSEGEEDAYKYHTFERFLSGGDAGGHHGDDHGHKPAPADSHGTKKHTPTIQKFKETDIPKGMVGVLAIFGTVFKASPFLTNGSFPIPFFLGMFSLKIANMRRQTMTFEPIAKSKDNNLVKVKMMVEYQRNNPMEVALEEPGYGPTALQARLIDEAIKEIRKTEQGGPGKTIHEHEIQDTITRVIREGKGKGNEIQDLYTIIHKLNVEELLPANKALMEAYDTLSIKKLEMEGKAHVQKEINRMIDKMVQKSKKPGHVPITFMQAAELVYTNMQMRTWTHHSVDLSSLDFTSFTAFLKSIGVIKD